MKKILLVALLLGGSLGFSQRNFTIEEATFGAYTTFKASGITNPIWRDANTISYLSPDYKQLLHASKTNGFTAEVLISYQELQQALQEVLKSEGVTLAHFPLKYQWLDANTLSFHFKSKVKKYIATYNLDSKQIKQLHALPLQANEILENDKHSAVAYLIDNNIELLTKDGKIVQVTSDTDKNIVNGSSNTHRNEFGIQQGMWFNKQGNKLLYYRKDQRMVADYPLVNFKTSIATVKNIKYPMAGQVSEEVSLLVYDISKNATISLNIKGAKDQFLTSVTWEPSGAYVYVGVLNRAQNHLELNKYNATTGAFVSTLFEESSKTYVEPQHPLYFNPQNDKEFVYLTDKNGYRQPYLYSTSGKLLKKLGYQNTVITNFLGFHKGTIYYTATANTGLDQLLYSVSTINRKTKVLTPTSGVHQISVNPEFTAYFDAFSNVNLPQEQQIVTISGEKLWSETSKNPYAGIVNLPKMELIKLKSADTKTDLNARIIYPLNFDATKKYPVIVYVYGGPHAQLVTNSWLGGASLFDYYLAQQGFVVFTLDNRGSANRGRDFEQVIHRNLGKNEMADQMQGIAYLKSKPYVDAEKIGVSGWSFGGFMTTSLLLNHPEVFKAGVAGGPVIDWRWYEVMYGERYMDTPKENPQGYMATSLLDKVSNLQAKLLMIHGAQDPVVVQQHSMEFIEACIKSGKQVDYFLYPTHEHNVSGADRFHLNKKIADYFLLHLKK